MKKIYYTLISLIISTIILIILGSTAYATNASISASSNKVEKGTVVTINANIDNASSWALDLVTSGGKLNKVDARVGNTDSGNNESKTIKIGTFSADSAGTYTITLSGYVVDGDSLTKKNVGGTVQITVIDPTPVTPEPEPETPTVDSRPESEPEKPTTPAVLEFTSVNETVYAKGTVNVRETYSSSSKQLGQLREGDSVTRTGVSKTTNEKYYWSKIEYNGTIAYVISSKLTTTKPQEEKPEEEIAEEQKEEPEVIVEEPTNEEISKITGGLKGLDIEGLTLTPTFSSGVYEYRVIVKEDLSELKINAEPFIENATITIAGNQTLQEGENLITIIVYDAKKEVEATYQITVNKSTLDLSSTDKILQIGTKEATRNLIIFIAALAIAIIVLIVVLILKRRNDYEYYEEEEEEFTDLGKIVENIPSNTVQDEYLEIKKEKRKGKHF